MIFSFSLGLRTIRPRPLFYLNTTFVKNNFEFVGFHLQGILMVQDGIQRVNDGYRRNIRWLYFVRERRDRGIPSMHCSLDHLQVHVWFFAPFQTVQFLFCSLNAILLSNKTEFGSLQILHILEDHLMQGCLVLSIGALIEELACHVPIALGLFALLIENEQNFVEIVLVMEVVVAELARYFFLQILWI